MSIACNRNLFTRDIPTSEKEKRNQNMLGVTRFLDTWTRMSLRRNIKEVF